MDPFEKYDMTFNGAVRLEQRAGIVGQVVRQWVAEVLVMHDVAGERPVYRRGGEEPDVGAQVVPPGPARPAPAAGTPGSMVTRWPIFSRSRPGPRTRDHPCGLVPEDQGPLTDRSPIRPLGKPVDVRAADTDGAHLDEDLARPWFRYGTLLDLDMARADHDSHRCRCHKAYRSSCGQDARAGMVLRP